MAVRCQTTSKCLLQAQARPSVLRTGVCETFTIGEKSEDEWACLPCGCCSSTRSSDLECSNHETIVHFDLNLDLPATTFPGHQTPPPGLAQCTLLRPPTRPAVLSPSTEAGRSLVPVFRRTGRGPLQPGTPCGGARGRFAVGAAEGSVPSMSPALESGRCRAGRPGRFLSQGD